MIIRRVERKGIISWHNKRVFISEALAGETVGLLALDERYYRLCFDKLDLGVVDTHHGRLLRGKAAAKALARLYRVN